MSDGPPIALAAYDATYAEVAAQARANRVREHGRLAAVLLRYGEYLPLGFFGGLLVAGAGWIGAGVLAAFLVAIAVARRRGDVRGVAVAAVLARLRGRSAMFEIEPRADALHVREPLWDLRVPWGAVSVEDTDGDVVLGWSHTTLRVPARAFADAAARGRFVDAVRARVADPPATALAPGGIPFTLTRGDRRAAGFEAGGRGTTMGILGGVLLVHLVLVVGCAWGGAFDAWLVLFAALSALFWLGLLLGPSVMLVEFEARRREPRHADAPVRVVLDVAAARFASEVEVAVPWPSVTAFRRGRRGLFLRSGVHVFLIPRRAFADTAAFEAFAADAERLWRGPPTA